MNQPMTIKPLRDQMLLVQIPPKMTTNGGILLVDQYQDDRMQWIVVAAGPKCKYVQAGDKILTPLYFDHVTLDDGSKLVSETQAIMRWGRKEDYEENQEQEAAGQASC